MGRECRCTQCVQPAMNRAFEKFVAVSVEPVKEAARALANLYRLSGAASISV